MESGSRPKGEPQHTVVHPPRVERIDLQYVYPKRFGHGPRVEGDSGDIYAPAGTRVRVRVHTDKPIVSGQMVFAERAQGTREKTPDGLTALERVGDHVLEGELVLARDDSYRIGLRDHDGLESTGDTE